MKTTLAVLLCTLVQPYSCSTDGSSASTSSFDPGASPFLQARGGGFAHVHVWAKLDDELEGWFLFDSGGQGNRLNKSVAERLGLELRSAGWVNGVSGSASAFRAQAETLQVGPMTMSAPKFIVPDVDDGGRSDVLGTLGSDVFEQCVVVYDAAGPSVGIYDPATFVPPPVEWETCLMLEERPFAHMQVEGQEVLLEIDTGGARAVLLCTPAADRLGLREGREVGEDSVYGNYGSAPVQTVTLERVDVGAQTFDGVAGTLGVENKGWLGSTEHDGLIGGPLLSYMVLILDYTNERVSFTDRRLFALLESSFDSAETAARSALQAAGKPDTVDAASYGRAWWPADENGKHWLELSYAAPVLPVRMEIWGTYAQGALTSVQATTSSGRELSVDWAGEVETTLTDGLALTASSIELDEPVVSIRLDLDCSLIGGTNIIDAVGLIDATGTTHWAEGVRADGSRHRIARPGLDAGEALEAHAARLQERGREQDAAAVRSRIEALED